MKRQKLLACLIVTIMIVSIHTLALAAGKHALLIGIQDYDYQPMFASLNGPANDLKIVEKVLRDRFGFEDGNFLILADASATHSRIEDAFKTLIDTVKPGDFVYIHYSGHGSQTQDQNGDERSDQDQTWVSYGARRDDSDHIDNFEVLDDEINAWLAALYEKNKNIVFVSDSCHSATVSRNMSLVNRAAPVDTRLHLRGKEDYDQLEKNFAVRVGAARDREYAIELLREDDTHYGLFTWYWVKALQQARKKDTWNDVFKRAYAQVTAERGYVQRPQIWGERGLQIDSGVIKLVEPKISIIEVKDDTVTISAGFLSGVTKGSIYRLDSDKADLPTLKIDSVSTFESTGNAENAEKKFKKGDLLIEERHAYNFPPIEVALFADYPEQKEDKSLLRVLRSAFQPPSGDETPRFPGYALAKDSNHADLHLYIVRPKKENGEYIPDPDDDVLPQSFSDQPPEVWVLTPEHQVLYKDLQIQFDDQKPTEGMRDLQKKLSKFARIQGLKALGADWTPPLPVTLDAHLLTPVDSCQEGWKCRTLPGDLGLHRETGPYNLQEIQARPFIKNEILYFTLRNESEEEYYCYLLNISPDWSIKAFFPYPGRPAEDALIGVGKTLRLKKGLKVSSVGEETVKIITSRQPLDVSLLEMRGVETRKGEGLPLNPLERLFVNAVHTRAEVVELEDDDWATDLVSFEVE